MLVHFPIALVILGFVADLLQFLYKKEICFSKISFYLLVTGTIAAIITLLSGILFTADLTGAAGNVQERHEFFAWTTVILLLIASVIRTFLLFRKEKVSGLKWVALISYGLAMITVSITGFLGGTIVYNYLVHL